MPAIYEGMNITYMGIEAHDSCEFDMSVNFQAAADFIHRALSGGGERGVVEESNSRIKTDFFWRLKLVLHNFTF